MSKDLFRIPKNDPNLNQNITTLQTINQISARIREKNNGFRNLIWIIVSIITGVGITILMSYDTLKNYGIYGFFIFLLAVFYILWHERKKKITEINELQEDREKTIGELYLSNFFDMSRLYDYATRKVISQNYLNYIIHEKNRQQFEFAKQQPAITIMPPKIKVTYKDDKSEIYERSFIDGINRQIIIFDQKGEFSKIVFIDIAEVKSVEIVEEVSK